MSMCYKCEEDVGDDDYTECDGCDALFHLRCGNVRKKDVEARENSKCLKIYCTECFEAKSEGTANKLKDILGLLYKIDMCTQEQKTSIEQKLPVTIEQKFNALSMKINSVPATTSNQIEKTTHTNVNKRSVKPVVVIKPKTKQLSAKTFDDISKNVNKTDVNVCSTKKIRNGAVVLRCENPTESMKVKQVVTDKLGENYDVVLQKIKNPRIRITKIDKEIDTDRVIDELKKNNPDINQINMKLVTIIHRKRYSTEWNDAIIEVKANDFKRLMEMGVLSLPWRECKILEHLHINRCHKCCGYLHKSNICKQEQKCSRCAGSHKHSQCNVNNLCCINCKTTNEKFKTNLQTDHHAWSKECSVFKRRLAQLVSKIEYENSE